MNRFIPRLAGIVSNDIQVSGIVSQEFPESRWREAILFYLFGVWSGRESMTCCPKIIFGDIALCLDSSEGEYYAYGTPHEELLRLESSGNEYCAYSSESHKDLMYSFPVLEDEKLKVTSSKQADVEVALVRFVKNDLIKLLTLCLRDSGRLVLWKKPQRGQYGITATDIPRSLE